MDHISIPSFALLRYGTVIVRLKMEKFVGQFWEGCRAEVRPRGVNRVVNRVSSCEHCTRTRIVSQCSDCDSAKVGKCRPYRTRAAKIRYVNVCAAVCLLLLVGGLTPQSSAAPYRTRAMDRTKRAVDQENETWSNPCDYDTSNMNPLPYKPELAQQVSKQAQSALASANMYKNNIDPYEQIKMMMANLHDYENYEKLVETWKATEWLRNHSWFTDDVLPKDKELGRAKEDKAALVMLVKSDNLKMVLPALTKAMKVLGASLRAVAGALYENDMKEKMLKSELTDTSDKVRQVLCLTSEVLRARRLPMLPLYDRDVPTYSDHGDVTKDVFLIYRDTINFLEYVDEFFEAMSEYVPN